MRTFLILSLSAVLSSAANVSLAAGDHFAFPRQGSYRLSIGYGIHLLTPQSPPFPFTTPTPAKSAPEFRKTEFQALVRLAANETDHKFAMIKDELESRIQYTLRIMDPENQTIQRQYGFLLEKLASGK